MNLSEFPLMQTPRTLLRKIVQDDLQNIYHGLSHPEVIKYYGVSYHTLDATQAQMDWFSDLEKQKTGIWWAICAPDNSMFYGAGGFNALSQEHKKAEIGFWLLPEYWGKGLMQEVFPLICKYGFETLQLNRIEGFVDNENTACKSAIEKMNFKHEGTMRNCELKGGKYISVDIYSQLSNDPKG